MTSVEAWRILDFQLNGRGYSIKWAWLKKFSRALRANSSQPHNYKILRSAPAIASTHAQMCPHIMCSATYALITSAELILATRILRELTCTSPHFLALEPESFSTTAAYSFVFAV